MAQKTEHCENCGKVIGGIEQAYVYEGRVVCHQCNEALRHPTYVTQTKSVSGLGIAALVLGLIACLGCWIPMCGIFSLPFAILGGLFGVIGIIIANLKKKSYVGLPIAGTIVCVTAAFIVIAVTGATVSSIEESSRAISEGLRRTRESLSYEQSGQSDKYGIAVDANYVDTNKPFSAKPESYYKQKVITNIDDIGVIEKAFFGVYLGETLDNLQKRYEIEYFVPEYTFGNGDSDKYLKHYKVFTDSAKVKYMFVETFQNRVESINVYLHDGSWTNYEAIKKEIESKYEVKSTDMFGERFNIQVGGEVISVYLPTPTFRDENRLFYTYDKLEKFREAVETKIKAQDIKDEL